MDVSRCDINHELELHQGRAFSNIVLTEKGPPELCLFKPQTAISARSSRDELPQSRMPTRLHKETPLKRVVPQHDVELFRVL
jgi:hypothetical protein